MLAAFVIVALIAGGSFYVQYRSQYENELSHLTSRFQERALTLEYVMTAAADIVDGMQRQAELYLKAYSQPPPDPALGQLEDAPDASYFCLDHPRAPLAGMVGNLTGDGPLATRSAASYREMNMALSLNPAFYIATQHFPNIAWAYYTSANRFINIYPWVSSGDFKFSDELYTHGFYTMGLPGNNPQRQVFWTEAYVDEAGKGMMVTCAAPVYDGDQFMGTVAVDYTLDILNTFVGDLGYAGGRLFIVNQYDQLLAHQTLVSSQDKTVKSLDEALPEPMRGRVSQQQTNAEPYEKSGYLLLYRSFQHVPWRLIYWVPSQSVVTQAIANSIGDWFTLMASLVAMLLVTNVLIRREFIVPAQRLVAHIESESKQAAATLPNVPSAWQPWFEAVSNAFAENRRLFQEHLKLSTIQRELLLARQIQHKLLLPPRPGWTELDLICYNAPAREVGGDFYAYYAASRPEAAPLGRRYVLALGDVSDKGMPAALLMSISLAMFQVAVRQELAPGELLKYLDKVLAPYASPQNCALVCVELDVGGDGSDGPVALRMANAACIPPYIKRANGDVQDFTFGGLALGQGLGIQTDYQEVSLTLSKGDMIVLVSDGVIEARNASREMFGFDRLAQAIRSGPATNVEAMLEHLKQSLAAFIGRAEPHDDITMVVAQV